jgi:hypothetical protein
MPSKTAKDRCDSIRLTPACICRREWQVARSEEARAVCRDACLAMPEMRSAVNF